MKSNHVIDGESMEDDNRFGVIRERKTSSLKKIIRVIVAVFALYFLVVPAVIAIIHALS